MTLSERITYLLNKTIKKDKLFTQLELSQKMNVSPASVNKWMQGGTPDIDKLPKLCELLNVTPNELFGLDDKDFTQALELYKAFKQHPEYQSSVCKLLELILKDIEENG